MNEENSRYFDRMKLIKLGKLPPEAVPKPRNPLNKISPKKAAEDKREKEAGTGKVATKLQLDKWFDDIFKKHGHGGSGANCMECGQWIPPKFMRHATAHLLPKKLFKSVATHELNYLILCAGNGCHEKTHRIDKFVTLSVWPEAARRIKIMMPLLPFDELKHLSSQLLLALDNTD